MPDMSQLSKKYPQFVGEGQSTIRLAPQQIGKSMTLPYGEDEIDNAIEYLETLQKKKKEQQEMISVDKIYNKHPLEGAYALAQVLGEMFNWSALVPSPGFFGPEPPKMIKVHLLDKSLDIPFGSMEIPTISGQIKSGAVAEEGSIKYYIRATVARRHYDTMQDIFNRVDEKLKATSIYQGQAIKLTLPKSGEGYEPLTVHAPKIMDALKFDESNLILGQQTRHELERDLFTPLRQADRCREVGISLKRGILLEGPPGTGKTLTAMWTAKEAVKAGWTFAYIDDCNMLKHVIEFGLQHQPCVVFAEDVDRIGNGAEDDQDYRTDLMNMVLNVLDGVESKNTELMIVLTTNHLDRITSAMKRPGRLDSIITLDNLDSAAAGTLVRRFAGNTLDTTVELPTTFLDTLTAYSPAVIGEIVQRAKLNAINRPEVKLTLEDFQDVLTSMNSNNIRQKAGMGFRKEDK